MKYEVRLSRKAGKNLERMEHTILKRVQARIDELEMDPEKRYSTSPGSNYNNVIVYLTPELSYKLTEKFSLNSSYTYGWRDDLSGGQNIGAQTVSRNLAWIYLRYTNQLHYSEVTWL